MHNLSENPFRVLGVYANASSKEILASKSKIMAFSKVGKEPNFSSDQLGNLPPVTRNAERVAEACSQLFIPEERIKHSQLWFLRMDSTDTEALEQLIEGDIDSALRIWGQCETVSSLQNQMLCYFLKGDNSAAIMMAERLYEQFSDNYIRSVDTSGANHLSGEELTHQFIDTISEYVDLFAILEHVRSSTWQDYIKSVISRSTIDELTQSLEMLQNARHRGLEEFRSAGEKLMHVSQEPLRRLRQLFSKDNVEYQIIADKVSTEILDCCIEYINNSKIDAYDRVMKTFEMVKFAKDTAVGQTVKKRCRENYTILLPISRKSKKEYHHIMRAPFRKKLRRWIICSIILASCILCVVTEEDLSGLWHGLIASVPFCYIASKIMNLYE